MRTELQFWNATDMTAGPYACWPWKNAKSKLGYGRICWRGHNHNAHRVAWEIYNNRKADPKKHVDHLCRNPSCVNPAHLELVNSRENTIVRTVKGNGAIRSRQTHCLRGHEFTSANTYLHKSRKVRVCRACHRDFEREKWRRTHVSYSRNHEVTR